MLKIATFLRDNKRKIKERMKKVKKRAMSNARSINKIGLK